jgi:uncharacterized protein (TIGR01244 family)
MIRLRPLALVVLALLLPPLAGCQSAGKRVNGIDNFATVQDGPDGIYRGAQPQREGFETLQSRGVRTVINLRNDPVADEPDTARANGLRYVHIPTSAGKIEPEKVRRFLFEVQTSPRPVFVHCAFGCDRTGLEIAVYRIVIQNWSREDAIRELYAHGYHWALYPGIARYLKSFKASDYLPGTSS